MANSKRPPGPNNRYFISDTISFYRNPIESLRKATQQYGDFSHFGLGPWKFFILNHPDYVQEVLITNYKNFIKGPGFQWLKHGLGEGLITSEGSFHRRQKRLLMPAFHRNRIEQFGTIMTDFALQLRESWNEAKTLDVAPKMLDLALQIAAKTLFGADIESYSKVVSDSMNIFMENWWKTLWMKHLPFTDLMVRLPFPRMRLLLNSRDRLNTVIFRLINERRSSGEDRGDLLSMLLLAQDDQEGGTGMTDEQVRDEAMTILMAGHETTGTSLTWTWYLLSQNPDAEAKLHNEIDTVLGNRLPKVEDLKNLTYTRAVFAESLRLYPPVWLLTRQALVDCKIDSYTVPAKSIVMISPFLIHRDPRFYNDPEAFKPERWSDEKKDEITKLVYIPFSAGPRQCIGEQFAWMEAVLVIATIAQRWKMTLKPGHPVELQPLITLRAKHGMMMQLEERNART